MSTLNNVVLFVLVLSVGSVVPVSGQSLIDQAISKAATQAAQQNGSPATSVGRLRRDRLVDAGCRQRQMTSELTVSWRT